MLFNKVIRFLGLSCPPALWKGQVFRVSTLSLLIVLSLVFLGGGTAFAKKKEVVVSGGYLLHRITFDDGYGAFLKRRYNVDHLDLRGPRILVSYMLFDRISLGLELDKLAGEFEYDSLNSTTHTANFELTQTILKLHYQLNLSWNLELGLGNNTLSRTMYGYQGYYISESSFANSEASATDESKGSVSLLGIIYEGRSQNFGWELGARYTQSKHDLPADSKRPGLDSKGTPEDQEFNLSGLGYHAALVIYF